MFPGLVGTSFIFWLDWMSLPVLHIGRLGSFFASFGRRGPSVIHELHGLCFDVDIVSTRGTSCLVEEVNIYC